MTKSTIEDFQLGETITYRNTTGYITFIDQQYITYCVKETNLPPKVAQHSKRPTNQVNVLIYRQYWHLIQSTTPVHQNDN
jgi:hypothetical protein